MPPAVPLLELTGFKARHLLSLDLLPACSSCDGTPAFSHTVEVLMLIHVSALTATLRSGVGSVGKSSTVQR